MATENEIKEGISVVHKTQCSYPWPWSWMASWLRWVPTSSELLKQAEQRITKYLKSLDSSDYVSVGCIGEDLKTNHQVWTLKANTFSTNTPLVLIHGFGSGSALWCLNIDSLAQQRPVYTMDILGFGRSSRPKFSTEASVIEEQFVSSIEQWRLKLGLNKFILLGHSFGGFLAAAYALKHPERVSHLILGDPWGFPPRPPAGSETNQLPTWARAVASIMTHFNPLAVLRVSGPLGPGLIHRIRPDLAHKFSGLYSEASEDIPTYLYHCNAQTPSGETAFQSILSGLGWAKHPMLPRLEGLDDKLPITFIYGARSWVDQKPGFDLQEKRPNSYVDVQILMGSSHHVYADRADLFNNLVNQIGDYTDRFTLPAHPSASSQPPPDEGGDPLGKLYNVRNDTTQGRIDTDKEQEGKGKGNGSNRDETS